jgi:6-phosphogluconolactonase
MTNLVFFFAGSYTDPDFPVVEKGRGIALLAFDPVSGQIQTRGFTPGIANPSYLALRPDGQVLYAANELVEPGSPGRVSAFRVEEQGLTALNDVSSAGEAPCHLSVDPTGRHLFVAHYTSGSVAVFPLLPDGSVAAATAVQRQEGSGPAPNQKSPHAHMVALGPGARFVYCTDLGADTVSVGRWDPAAGRLEQSVVYRTARGAGPRHFVFSALGDRVYVVCEITGTVEVCAVEPETGALSLLQTVSTLPPGETRPAGCGTIRLSPSGRHLYVANRLGVDTLAVYDVDAKTGLLTIQGWHPSGGSSPRDFVLDPSGRFLLVANQSSGTVNVFRIDAETGALTDTGHAAAVPMVTCLVALA